MTKIDNRIGYAEVLVATNEQFAKDQSTRHQWLSKQQQARFAILPVHTQDERHLFHLYAKTHHYFPLSMGNLILLVCANG